MTDNGRVLPIVAADGRWIERPDLYVLARMGCEDTEKDAVVEQIHDAMVRADNSVAELNKFERSIESDHIRRNLTRRKYAGNVVISLCRIAATTGLPPLAAEAIRLTGVHLYQEKKRSSVGSFVGEVKQGFATYRNTAHLQAAMVIGNPGVSDIENSEPDLIRLLARARALEMFIDNYVVSKRFKWDPWRVPAHIAPDRFVRFTPLSDDELRAMKAGSSNAGEG